MVGPNRLLRTECIAEFLPVLRMIAHSKIPRHERDMWFLNHKMDDLRVALATLQENRMIDAHTSSTLRLAVLRVKNDLYTMGAQRLQKSAARAAAELDGLPRDVLEHLVEIEDDWFRSPSRVRIAGLVIGVSFVACGLRASAPVWVLLNIVAAIYLGLCLLYELHPIPAVKDVIITMQVSRLMARWYELTARKRRLIRFGAASVGAVLLMVSFMRAAASLDPSPPISRLSASGGLQ